MTSNLDRIRDQQRDTWDQFAMGWKSWDAMVCGWLAPVGAAMIRQANLGDNSHLLDVATGTGEPGLSAAALVPLGRVTLTDLSERMLAVAGENAAHRGLRNVETKVGEAGALPFPDASFDAVLCRFGFMFFPDMGVAAREFVRVSRPGARVSAAVWSQPEDNPWATIITSTIARHVAMPASPPLAPSLFRCASGGLMSEVFDMAGLRDITEEEVSCDMIHETAERYWDFMTNIAAPVVTGLAKADSATQQEIHAEVLDLAQQSSRDGQVYLQSTATVVAGTVSPSI